MEKIQFNLPDMWADHHVLKVREIVGGLGGVQSVVASSAFRIVAVEYDPAAIGPAQIEAALVAAGYQTASQPGTVNPVVPAQSRSGDAGWARQGFRVTKTDGRDLKTAR